MTHSHSPFWDRKKTRSSEVIEPRTRGLRAYTETLSHHSDSDLWDKTFSVSSGRIRFYPETWVWGILLMWCGQQQKRWLFSGVAVVTGGCAVLALGSSNEGWAVRRLSPSPAGQLAAGWNEAREGQTLSRTVLAGLPSSGCFCPPKLHFGKKWSGET